MCVCSVKGGREEEENSQVAVWDSGQFKVKAKRLRECGLTPAI